MGHSFSSKEQVPFNFMAAVTICSEFEAQESKVCHCFHYFPIYLSWRMTWMTRMMDAMILVLWTLSFQLTFSLSSFTLLFLIKRPFTSSSLSAKSVIFSRIFPNLGLCEASSYLSWGYTFQQNTKRDVPFSVWYIRRHIISINLWEFLGSFLNSNF